MIQSLWGYIRSSTRDAILAGFQDAMEVVERGEAPGAHYAASQALLARLTPLSPPVAIDATPVPPKPAQATEAKPVSQFDAELEARLASAEATPARPKPGGQAFGPLPDRPRRGRPPGKSRDARA